MIIYTGIRVSEMLNLRMKDIAQSLLFEKSPRTVRCEEFNQRILNQNDDSSEKAIKKANAKVEQIKSIHEKFGTDKDWIVEDIPKKQIIFVSSKKSIIKNKQHPNILLERDPVKILTDSGDVQLLVDVENSIISQLQNSYNFVPNVYCSDSAYNLLVDQGIIP